MLDPVAVPAEKANSSRSAISTESKILFSALFMVAIHLGFRAWGTIQSWFFADDLMFLGIGNTGKATIDWVFNTHNVHIMPVGLGLSIPASWFEGYPWWFAATQILVMATLTALSFLWMLVTLFGVRWGILIPLGIFLFSSITAPTTVWWAAALNQLPHATAMFLTIGFFTKYLRTSQRKFLISATGLFVLGLASYSKAILIPPFLFIFALAYFSSGNLFERVRFTIFKYIRAWLAFAGSAGIYLIIYSSTVENTASLSWGLLKQMSQWILFQSYLPGIMGGPLNWNALNKFDPRLISSPTYAMVVLSGLVLIAIFVRNLARYRHSAVWLALLSFYLAGHIVIITKARGMFGFYGGLETRYLYDVVAIGALTIALSYMTILQSVTPLEPRRPGSFVSKSQKIVLAVGVMAWLGASTYSTILYTLPWHDDRSMPQRTFIETTRASVLEKPFKIAEVWVPEQIMSPLFFPYNTASNFFSPVSEDVTVVSSGNDLHVFNLDGDLFPAVILGDPRNLPGPVAGCGFLVTEEPVTIPIAGVIDFNFWMTINYLSGAPGQVKIDAGNSTRTLEVENGLHTGFVTTEGSFDEITFTPIGSTALCVDQIRVGQLVPFDVDGFKQ